MLYGRPVLQTGGSSSGPGIGVNASLVAVAVGTAPIENPFPSGVTFSGPAFSEPALIGLAYAFEQATHHRQPPASTPPLPTDSVSRP
jgi:amidase